MLARARSLKNDNGFTLIELLIVIVILGVLSAVVVFSVSGINDRGTVAACKSDVATLSVAYEAYVAKDPAGAKPTSYADLVTAGLLQSAPATNRISSWSPLTFTAC